MAYSPISNTVPQYHVDGVPASGYALKAYIAGTSTLLQMATDAAAGTLLNRVPLNSQGYPVDSLVLGNTIIPHLNAAYKLALYPSVTAADANSGAIWTIDNLTPSSIVANISISGNTISSTNTNGDITLDPNGSGQINLSGITSATTINAQVVDTQSLELNNVAVTSTAAELNILDGVTSTAAELNKNDDSVAAVANYASGMREYLYNILTDTAITSFDIVTNVTENTFESVGPTGSSATNIYASMDVIPAGAVAAVFTLVMSTTASGAGAFTNSVFARNTGSSLAVGNSDIKIGYAALPGAGNAIGHQASNMVCPLDSSRRFDTTWVATGDSARVGLLYLTGWIL